MSFARIVASLGIDTTAFQSGLDKANGAAERFKRTMQSGDIDGPLKKAFTAGAIIQGFRGVLERAQAVRNEAEKLGKTVDAGTASVARYADAWDSVKAGVADVGVSGLSWFTQLGEAAGDFINQLLFKPRGFSSPEEALRVSRDSEQASANADRLSTPAAKEAAKKRREEKGEAESKAFADGYKDEQELAKLKEKNARAEMTWAEELTYLQEKRAFHAAKALTAGSVEDEKESLRIAGEIGELERKMADDADKKHKEELKAYDERARKILDLSAKQMAADKKVAAAEKDLATQKRDFYAASLADAAAGKRGSSKDQATARQILKDEAMARRLTDTPDRTVSLWDADSQSHVQAGAGFFAMRAKDARDSGNFKSDDRNPFGDAEEKLKSAADEQKTAATELRSAIAELKTVEIEIVD